MPQRHLWVDGVAARHAENLQVRVVAVAFVHLRVNEGGVSQRSAPLAAFLASTGLAENRHEMNGSARASAHLLILLHVLLLGLGDDALQFVEASLHLGEAQPGVLLLPPDAFQLLLAVLLGDAGTLLPLLDTLRKDLVDATGKHKKKG